MVTGPSKEGKKEHVWQVGEQGIQNQGDGKAEKHYGEYQVGFGQL